MKRLLLVLCLVTGLDAHVYDRGFYNQHAWKNLNFISTMLPRKGEVDVRVAQNGLLALEAMVPKLRESNVFLREITNGKTFHATCLPE